MSSLGNKQVMADNIKRLMKEFNVSQSDICIRLKLKPSTFSDWVNAKTYPRIDKIEMLANYFGVEKSDLIEDKNENNLSTRIPVLGTVKAGIPITAIQEILDYEEISSKMARCGEYFALRIKGDSMEPRMYEGDVVIVKQQNTVDNGQIAIVLVNGDEATVKKVRFRDNGIELIAFNSYVYEPHFYSAEDIHHLPVQIIGRVVELRAKF